MINILESVQNLDKNEIILIGKDKEISAAQFLNQIEITKEIIQKYEDKSWVIFFEDSCLFSIALFALLGTKKDIVIIPDSTSGTLEKISKEYSAIISDQDIKNNLLNNIKIGYKEVDNYEPKNNSDFDPESRIFFFTSGSTGNPKKVEKKLENIVNEILNLDKLFGKEINQNYAFNATVSHQHIYGFLFRIIWPIFRGNKVNYKIILNSEELDDEAEIFKTILISSPAFLKRLAIDNLEVKSENIDKIFSSGGLLEYDYVKELNDRFNFEITEILGSTETGGIASRNQLSQNLWKPLPEVAIKIDSESALLVKSSHINSKDFIKTGDMAEIVNQDHFLLKERLDRIAKIEEKRVSLAEVEKILNKHEFISNSYVLVSNLKRQMMCAVIELNDKGFSSLKENGKLHLNQSFRSYLANYFELVVLPKKWRYVYQLPANSQGKIIKSEIEKLFQ